MPARPVERFRALHAADRPLLLPNAWDFVSAASLDVTVERCRAYAAAGADGVFVPGLGEPAALRTVVDSVAVPVNVLHGAGGLSLAQLADLGVRRVSTGSLLFRAALGAATAAAVAAREDRPVPAAPAYRTVQELLARWPAGR